MHDEIRALEAMIETFNSEGWKCIEEDLDEALTALTATTHALNTLEELHQRKGEIRKLQELLALPTVTRAAIETLEEEERYAQIV